MTHARSRARLAAGTILLLAYAAPLFFPPGPAPLGSVAGADAWLLQRIFPGVPASWVGVRLLALAVAAVLLTGPSPSRLRRSLGGAWTGWARPGTRVVRPVALGLAVVHACAAPWASRLGPVGQTVFVLMLAVPALLLAAPGWFAVPRRGIRWRHALPAAAVVVVWLLSRLVTDLHSPRVADVVDGWRGWLDDLNFVAQKKNLLTDLFDPKLPGVGGVLLFLHGMPLFQAGVLPLTFLNVQLFQIASVAVCAAGVGLLARLFVGPGVSAVAVAVFLFAPYTRFVTLFPGPFLAGPFYVSAVAACALIACRRRSEAAIAALGAASGVAIQFPGVVPAVVVFGALTAWHLRRSWRTLGVGFATALASFAAAVIPAAADVLSPGELGTHFRWDGLISIIDGNLLGQLPLRDTLPTWAGSSPRPLDVVISTLLAPFAHPRIAIRLWGDAIFDPVGGALIAVGLAACVRSAARSPVARVLLIFLVAVLCPAFVSPVDVVDIVHAVALPVPAAVLAAAGFAVIHRKLGWRLGRSKAAAVAAAVICLGGTVLFDVVNPRILGASSFGIMFRALRPDDASRVVVLAYGPGFVRPTKTLFTGPITAFGGPRPVGYLEYDGEDFPVSGLAAEGRDMLFWSHGFDQDFDVTGTVCRQWPGATFYEIWDVARLGRVHAARVSGAAWAPRDADGRWRSWDCETRGPR